MLSAWTWGGCDGAGSERSSVAVKDQEHAPARLDSLDSQDAAALGDAAAALGDADGAALDEVGDPPETPDSSDVDEDAGARAEPSFELDTGPAPGLCARTGRSDRVRDVFCGNQRPRIRSLAELERALGVELLSSGPAFGYGGVVLLAHSTALSGDIVSELNPRAIATSLGLFVAFSRGIQQVEIAAIDHDTSNVSFYLVRFQQACNAAANGCRPGDLYTPRIESDWLSTTLEDDEDLKNTPSDCRQCHQRGSEQAVLLMREFDGPWTHFFAPDQDEPEGFPEATGSALLRDYLRAKGEEPYANIPSETLRNTAGITLQNLVHRPQPLIFDGAQIMNERWPWHDGYASTPERSATWYAVYEAFKRGEQLPLPYFAPRISDPDKQAVLTQAYQRYRSGELDAADLPDFADIFPDDPQVRAEIGLQTEPGAAPAQTLIQACGPCHNDVLDQSISRARFNVALGRMSRAQLDLAIARLQLPRDSVLAMPPLGRRQIGPDDLAALITYLQKDSRSDEDDAALEHAAEIGMAAVSE